MVAERKDFTYSVRRSKKAKHILLHVDVDGLVELVVPRRASLYQAEQFLREKDAWVQKMLQKQTKRKASAPTFRVEDGATLPWFDSEFTLRLVIESTAQKTSLREEGGLVRVRAKNTEAARAAIMRWYKKTAREFFVGEVITQTKKIGVQVVRVRVTNPKSQWGSCNKQTRSITFSWRLALAPLFVAQYVVVHEVSHLLHANHGPKFWKQVESLMPDYAQAESWLKKHGIGLTLQ